MTTQTSNGTTSQIRYAVVGLGWFAQAAALPAFATAANTRMKTATGGGTLPDIGIYCINAARYLFQSEPISVFATSASKDEARFG